MTTKPFIDTNILVYAYSRDEQRKATAGRIIADGGIISVQVINEFIDVARRKLKLDWDQIGAIIADFGRHLEPPVPVTMRMQAGALELCRQHGFRIYDGLVVAAADAAGCTILFTEDLQHGQRVGGVTITNPFRPTIPS